MTMAPTSRWTFLSNVTDETGAQLVEFAVTLPLLAVFIVGIFDFGSAFDTKQKLSNAAQEGARTGSLLPLNDLTAAAPDSVKVVRDVVARYLQGAGLNDCGLQAAATPAGTNMTWEYDLTGGGCIGTLKLKIERAYPLATAIGGNPTKLLNTRVTLTYPYQWKFNSVIQLMVPGGGTGVTEITAASTMLNQS